ncbi:MAG: hypothetical protein IH872_10610 [Chloroflexi bacterium]|nr:hypothetical protein [Chloroflexota bacterium]
MDLRPKLVFLMVLAVILVALGADSVSGAAPASLATTLDVTPRTALPNQTVTLLGTGFTPSTTAGGAASSGAHQVTGTGGSVIAIGETILVSPNLTYPIDFDGDGNWTASIVIPVTAEVVAGGAVTISVVDDQGLTRTTQVIIKTPSISLDPKASGINSDFTVTGRGFPAFNSATAAGSQVSISYEGVLQKVVSADSRGEFVITVQVPTATAISSNSTVRARVVGFDQSATAIHSVPGPSITVSPSIGVPGTVVTISGEGFPANVLVSSNRAGNITVSSSPAPATDNDGKFVSFFAMPVFSPGVQIISASAGGSTAVTTFAVLAGAPVSQPLPSPPPSTLPAQALETLNVGDNLIRVWTFDNSTKTWEFFDPRPAFTKANTIKTMVPGRIYWLRLNRVQTTSLNGKAVRLFEGWNLLPW